MVHQRAQIDDLGRISADLVPTDPAVLFGSVSLLHNVARKGVTRRVRHGEREPLGDISPGRVFLTFRMPFGF